MRRACAAGRLLSGLAAGLVFLPTAALADDGDAREVPRVVATIKPLHSLAATVMGEVAHPTLLIPGSASPHRYSMRPSDARAIANADVIVWTGEGLETFLEPALANVASEARIITVAELETVRLLSPRRSGPFREHAHDHSSEAEASAETHAHGHGGYDPHVWLDPDNAVAVVDRLAAVLAKADPDRAATYRTNARTAAEQIRALDQRINERLTPVRAHPYAVFHDAYHYFESHYGMQPVASVTLSPERKPGARRLIEIRQLLAETGARCIFREPQFAPDLIRNIVDGTEIRIGVLDPIGADLEPGPSAYFSLMTNLADSLVGCLSATTH